MCFNSYKGTIVMKGVSLMNIYYRSASIPIKEQLLYENNDKLYRNNKSFNSYKGTIVIVEDISVYDTFICFNSYKGTIVI